MIQSLLTTYTIGTKTNYVLTNGESTSIVIGTPVYISGNDSAKKAKANSSSTTYFIGLVADTSITNSKTGNITINGVLNATTTQWDAVAGTSGGLTANTVYYLSASTAGQITSTAPTTVGQYVVQVGIAISTTEMIINITRPILL